MIKWICVYTPKKNRPPGEGWALCAIVSNSSTSLLLPAMWCKCMQIPLPTQLGALHQHAAIRVRLVHVPRVCLQMHSAVQICRATSSHRRTWLAMLLASPTFSTHPAAAMHLADAVQLPDARARDHGHVRLSFCRAVLIEPQNVARQLWPA